MHIFCISMISSQAWVEVQSCPLAISKLVLERPDQQQDVDGLDIINKQALRHDLTYVQRHSHQASHAQRQRAVRLTQHLILSMIFRSMLALAPRPNTSFCPPSDLSCAIERSLRAAFLARACAAHSLYAAHKGCFLQVS